MGKRGPRPKTAEERRLAGNASKRPLADDPKPIEQVVPICPAWLQGVAKAKWDEMLPILQRLGRLDANCGDVLASYCLAWSELRMTTEILEAEGRVLKAKSGYLYPHPAASQQHGAMATILRLSAVMGLDPSSMSRMPPKLQEEEDELDEFLARRPKARFFPDTYETCGKTAKTVD
jgi:P27 family predicted phage terminase small subunit